MNIVVDRTRASAWTATGHPGRRQVSASHMWLRLLWRCMVVLASSVICCAVVFLPFVVRCVVEVVVEELWWSLAIWMLLLYTTGAFLVLLVV